MKLEMPCGGSGKARLGMCPSAQWMHAIKPALPIDEDREIDHLSKSPCVFLSICLFCLSYLSLVGLNQPPPHIPDLCQAAAV